MAKFKIRSHEEDKEYLIACDKCGAQDWYWIDISKSIRCVEPIIGRGPKCNGELRVIEKRKAEWRASDA